MLVTDHPRSGLPDFCGYLYIALPPRISVSWGCLSGALVEDKRRILTYATRCGSRIVCHPTTDGMLIVLPSRNVAEALGDAVSAVGGEGLLLMILLAGLVAFA